MSFFDVTGVLGTLVTLRDELEKLRIRYKTFKTDIPQAISDLTSNISECTADLQTLRSQLAGAKGIERNVSDRIEKQLEDIMSLCTEAIQTLRDVNQKLSNRLYGFVRARKIADSILNPLQTRFAAAITELKYLNGTFAVISVVEQSKGEVLGLIHNQGLEREREESFIVRFMKRSGPDLSHEMMDNESLEYSAKAAVTGAKARNIRQIVLQGGPGTGKTSTLSALSRDQDVHREFGDGVYWISLGISANMTDFVRQLSRIVASTGAHSISGRIEKANSEVDAVEEACNWFYAKRFLFLIDDVWKGAAFDGSIIPLLHRLALSGDDSVLVYSTRQEEMVGNSHHIRFHPRDICGVHSQRILNSSAGITFPENIAENSKYQAVLRLCEGIPFALAVAGRAVRRLQARNLSAVEAMEEFIERLDIEDDILDAQIDGYEGLKLQFQAALQILDETEDNLRQHTSFFGHYVALSVLQKQQFAPLLMLQNLWDVSFRSAYHIAGEFEGVGIAHLRYEAAEEGAVKIPGLRLNDLAHDFVLSQAKDSVPEYHKGLVESYRSLVSLGGVIERACSPWWDLLSSLKDGGYFSQNIVRHLDESGMYREVLCLLSDPRWFYGQLDVEGILQVESEIARVVGKSEPRDTHGFNYLPVLDAKGLRRLAWAGRLSLSTMAQNPREKWFQIHGRLLDQAGSDKGISEFIKKIEAYAPKPWIRTIRNCLEVPGGERLSFVDVARSVSGIVQLNDYEMLCGCGGGTAAVVNLRKSKVVRRWKFDNSERNVFTVAVSRDRSTLLFGLDEGPIQVVDGPNWTQYRTKLVGHSKFCTSLDVTDDNKYVLSSGYDQTIRLWDLEEGTQLGNEIVAFEGGSHGVNGGASAHCIAAIPGCHGFIVGGDDQVLRRLDIRIGALGKDEVSLLQTCRTDTSEINLRSTWRAKGWGARCMTYSFNGKTVVAGDSHGRLSSWDVGTGNLLKAQSVDERSSIGFWCVAISCDGKKLAAGGPNELVYVCDAESLEQIREPIAVHSAVKGVAFMDSDRVAATTKLGVMVLDISGKEGVGKVARGLQAAVFGATLAVDGRFFVTGSGGSGDDRLRVWDVDSGCQVGESLRLNTSGERRPHSLRGVTEVPNSNRVLTHGWDHTLRLCEISEAGHFQRAVLEGHEDMIKAVAVVPNGEMALSASNDLTVRVWDLNKADGRHAVLRGHKTYLGGVSVSPDGKLAMSRDRGEVRIWDIAKGSCLRVVGYENNFSVAPVTLWKELWPEEASYGRVVFDARMQWSRVSRKVWLASDDSVLATLESGILAGAYCEERHILCVGLENGAVGILKLEE
eukprot:GFKZ01003323.1.p1 GENE.GFKZ01003323.1~~GFKZ01003323.1.p1  ORF type:complete len:1318 (-),score=184.06 GFKZ01003323.1:1484-5437(-)